MNVETKSKSIRRTIGVSMAAGACLVGLGAVPAAADAPVHFSDSVTFTAVNPCTGQDHEVSIDFEIAEHQHRNNTVVHISRTGETSDGYVMNHGTESFVDNGNVARGAFTDNWRDSDGSKFKAQGVFVFDIANEQLRVDRLSFRCIGNN